VLTHHYGSNLRGQRLISTEDLPKKDHLGGEYRLAIQSNVGFFLKDPKEKESSVPAPGHPVSFPSHTVDRSPFPRYSLLATPPTIRSAMALANSLHLTSLALSIRRAKS